MLTHAITMQGEAAGDETQLDGRRHLTLECSDEPGDWLATIHLIVDLEGDRHEAELELEDDAGGVWSGAFEHIEDHETGDALQLQLVFRTDEGTLIDVALSESNAGAFTARLSPGDAARAQDYDDDAVESPYDE